MAHSTKKKHTCDLDAIQTLLRKFAKDRDWEQFHNPNS